MCSEIQEANFDGSGRCWSASLTGVPYSINIDPPLLGVATDTDCEFSGVLGTVEESPPEGVAGCTCGVTGAVVSLLEGVLVALGARILASVFLGFGSFNGVRLNGGGI